MQPREVCTARAAPSELYEASLRDGGIVVGVRATSAEQMHKLEKWFAEAGAEKVRAV